MDILTTLLSKFASGIGPFVLLLGMLIFVHELGHYLVAVWCGVRVETFSLGFGKKILQFKRGHTTYCVSLIPLGGYVKMFGDDPNQEISAEDKKHSFLHKPVRSRIAVVLAGPLMNLIFASAVFSVVGHLGEEVPGNKIGDVSSETAAYLAGFRSGDEILSVDNTPVSHWKEIQSRIENAAGRDIQFQLKRENGELATATATPALTRNEFIFTTQREIGKIEGLSIESSAAMIGVLSDKSPAAIAGLKTFDVIDKVNGREIQYWRDIERTFNELRNESAWTLTVTAYGLNETDKPVPREVVIQNTLMPEKNGESNNILSQLGIGRSDLFLLNIKPDAPAGKAGLLRGDRITSVDNKPIVAWSDILNRVKSYNSEQGPIRFGIQRGEENLNFEIAPEKIELPTSQGAIESRFAVGIVPAILTAPNNPHLLRTSGVGEALFYGIEKSWEWTKFIAISFVRLVQAEVSPRNIGGVITIGRVASQSFEAGAVVFLRVMAIISINLFLLNLLPVPVLDGGHLVFFTIEAIKGSPLSLKKMEMAQQFGLVLLLGLMAFALFNDIRHLISAW